MPSIHTKYNWIQHAVAIQVFNIKKVWLCQIFARASWTVRYCWWKCKVVQLLWKNGFLQVRYIPTIWPSCIIPWYSPRRSEIYVHIDTYTNAYRNFIIFSRNNLVFINWWLDKLWYIYAVEYYYIKKYIYTYTNTDEYTYTNTNLNIYAEWKMSCQTKSTFCMIPFKF